PVFFTAISTILGAILFLRFGFAVGTLGFWGVIFIILPEYPYWKNGQIHIFDIFRPEDVQNSKQKMQKLVDSERLPITSKNINIIIQAPDVSITSIINKYSENAGLTLIGIREELVKKQKTKCFPVTKILRQHCLLIQRNKNHLNRMK
ncbi:MAG: hypothetical protein CSA36_09075, partial [Draconibacterium sp.]